MKKTLSVLAMALIASNAVAAQDNVTFTATVPLVCDIEAEEEFVSVDESAVFSIKKNTNTATVQVLMTGLEDDQGNAIELDGYKIDYDTDGFDKQSGMVAEGAEEISFIPNWDALIQEKNLNAGNVKINYTVTLQCNDN